MKQVVIEGDILNQTFPKPIDLIITSPPYNVDIAYGSHNDAQPYDRYLKWSADWMKHCYELSASDGRFCLNIPLDTNKNGYCPIGADLTKIAESVGWKYRSTIIWNETNISNRTAWGSWKSASAPSVISPVELIVVFYKEDWKKNTSGTSDITSSEFIRWTLGNWTFNGENGKRIGHPAPFPIELPRRCIKLFSYADDVILDPFLGSGTTLLASAALNREAYGTEIFPTYAEIARNRLNNKEWEKKLTIWNNENKIWQEEDDAKRKKKRGKDEDDFFKF